MPKPDLDAAYDLTSPDAARDLYAAWADSYDSGFAEDMDYRLPQAVADVYVPFHRGAVLDLGAGTGLLGQALAARGLGPVDGTDLSPEMLAVARDKGVYRGLFAGNLLTRLPCDDGTYTGAVSSGTFTNGHVGPEALDEVLRCLAPGGTAVLSVNAHHFRALDFASHIDRLAPLLAQVARPETPIYGPRNIGPHAKDTAILLTLTKA